MDRVWLQKALDSKGRPCPMRLGDPCPGHKDGCAWWVELVISDGAAVDVQGGCAMLWQLPMLNESVLESRRAQASADKTATVIAKVGAGLVEAIDRPRRVLPQLNGGIDATSYDQTQ